MTWRTAAGRLKGCWRTFPRKKGRLWCSWATAPSIRPTPSIRPSAIFSTAGPGGCVCGHRGGWPQGEDVLEQVRKAGFRRVLLAPMMLVAGDHARNDMAGKKTAGRRCLKRPGLQCAAPCGEWVKFPLSGKSMWIIAENFLRPRSRHSTIEIAEKRRGAPWVLNYTARKGPKSCAAAIPPVPVLLGGPGGGPGAAAS